MDIETIQKEYLPETMRDMSTEEILLFVAGKKKDRQKTTKEFEELTEKRNTFVAEKQSNDSVNMLDNAIIQAIRKQAVTKGFVF
ncbi:MAG: hypothetical protein GXO88_03735 [Chlorobi bacterium]|nr:hypothetical protein [Chlorobiota bacterium]